MTLYEGQGPVPGPVPGGRRQLLLTTQLQDAIVQHLALGAFYDEACKAVGIGNSTFYGWLNRGRRAIDKEAEGGDLEPSEVTYLDFAKAVEQARGRATVYAHATIRSAMTSHWQAAAWYLERTNPARYGRWMRQADEVPTTEDLENAPVAAAEEDEDALAAVVTFAKRWAEDRDRQAEAS